MSVSTMNVIVRKVCSLYQIELKQEFQLLNVTHHSINSHVQHLPGPDNTEQPVNALKDSHHHLILVLRCWPVLRMGARVDNAVHVQVEVVKLYIVGIGKRGVHIHELAIYVGRLK